MNWAKAYRTPALFRYQLTTIDHRFDLFGNFGCQLHRVMLGCNQINRVFPLIVWCFIARLHNRHQFHAPRHIAVESKMLHSTAKRHFASVIKG